MYHTKISVRNLVEFIFRSGDITGGEGSFSKEAMAKGTRIHKKIQSRMKSTYEAEVPLSIQVERPDFILTIEGRADGINKTKDGVTIDEIKGVYKKLERINQPVYVHKAQAMCYAYMYAAQQQLDSISIQLTYCNLDTEEIKRFHEDFSFDQLQEWFSSLISEYCKWTQFEVDNKRLRNASIQALCFPYPYRAGQKDMAKTVYFSIAKKQNLFVQAPTGIGKTMAALFPAIKALNEGYGEKLFYLTAKTIARSVALNGLDTLREQGLHFRSLLITAKEKICPLEEMNCDALHCPYAAGHYDRINDAMYDCLVNEKNITREVLLEYSNKHMVCPFELSLDVSLFVDGIICDYNYVFDPKVKLRRYFGETANRDNYIFLVDEAHNLVERASSMYSTQLYKEDFLSMKRLLSPFHKKIGNLLGKCNTQLLAFKKQCQETSHYLLLSDIEDFYVKILRLHGHMSTFLEEIKEIPELQAHQSEILEFYFRLNQFINIYEILDDSYEVYVQQLHPQSFMLKLFCIHPANNLTQCIEKANATIFFSATLLPIQYYKELLHNHDEDYAIYIPSPFPKENRKLFVGIDVSSRYRMRNTFLYKKLAHYLELFVHGKSGKYIAFFPSYKMLEDVYLAIQENGYLQDIEIIRQSSNLTEEERENFLSRFSDNPKPVLGLCILGGIFSEGIDLTGDCLIGTAIIGTGLPMVCEEREIQQQYFNRKNATGFEYSYLYPGMNKVQQAAGRVIRTMEDRGVILLLDDRFVSRQVVETFPVEWEDYQVITLDTLQQHLQAFWDSFPDE